MAWNTKYNEEDLRLVPSKPILSDFGKALDVEDTVELHIYSRDNETLLFSDTDITSYKVAEGGILDDGTVNQDSVVFLDLHNDIRQFVNSGTFNVKYCFYRTIVGSPDDAVNDLFLDEISTSRNEIRLKISEDASQEEKEIFEDFADKLSIKGDVDHWVDIHVNFGNNVVPLAVNWSIDKITTPEFPYSIVLKLYEPLPEEINVKAPCWIVQEMITPVRETVFVESPEVEKEVNFLAPPNFGAGSEDNLGGGTTGYETWTSLTNAKEEVVNKVLNRYFSSSLSDVRLSVDYRRYSHFVRFGSAKSRLENFRYKLQQIEFFEEKIANLTTNSPATASNSAITGSTYHRSNVQGFKDKKNEVIAGFDGYERFLFEESSSYVSASLGEFVPTTWPKESDKKYPKGPYTNLSVTASDAIDWYDGMFATASMYDRENIHSLENTAVPLHIHEDPTLGKDEKINGEYIKFVNMVGEFFDNIYLYVTAIPETWDRHNAIDARLVEGHFSGSDMLSKDLIYMGLKSLGYSQCLKTDEQDLWSYVVGTDSDGQYGDKLNYFGTNDWSYWNQPDNQFASESYIEGTSVFSQSVIYASDFYQTSQSVPRENLRLEFGKRLLNNLPHLLKTKGTKENLKAYMNVYGIPQSLFRIKEWGSPKPVDYFNNSYYEYETFNYRLNLNGTSCVTASWDAVTDPTIVADNGNRVQFPDTIEFRFKLPDMLEYNLKCGKTQFNEIKNNANKKDMVVVQINSSSFIAVEHVSEHIPLADAAKYDFPIGEDSKYGRVKFGLGVNDGTYQYPSYFVSCSTDWAPIYDGDFWNVMVRRNSPSAAAVTNQITENFTYELFCKKSTDWARATITHEFSSSLSTNGSTAAGRLANSSWNSDGFHDDTYVSGTFFTPENTIPNPNDGYSNGLFGYNFDSFFIGGAVDSPDWSINRTDGINYDNYSGSLQEFRFWMKPLTESAFNNHVFNPMAIDGNTYTSSYHDLIVRYSFGADLKTYDLQDGSEIFSSHPNQDILTPFQDNRSTFATASGFVGINDFIDDQENVATIVPNYIGLNLDPDKIRVQENYLDGNLSSTNSAEAPLAQDNDQNRVSIQMTPVDQINIDIEHQLGGIDFNDLVGDPRAKYNTFYADVIFYDQHYWKKHFGAFKYNEFFKLIKYYDSTVLCQMKKNVPGRNKPDFNISVEPHILERPRLPIRKPDPLPLHFEGSASARVFMHGNTTELGRFKHNGPGDPFYNNWDNNGPEESRYGDLVSPNHRFGNRDGAHQLPQPEPLFGTGGQRERERNVTGLFRTTVGELEATIKPAFEPIIKDDIFMCWERDQHEGAARYEWHLPITWGESKGAYVDYSVTGTTSQGLVSAKAKIKLAGTFPNAGVSAVAYDNTTIVLTATDGTVVTFTCDDPLGGTGTTIAGSQFAYSNNPSTLATNIRTAINGHSKFTCGAVHQDGTIANSSGDQTALFVVPVTQSTGGAQGNTFMHGTFFPPYGYNPNGTGGTIALFAAHSASRFHVIPEETGFSGGKDSSSEPKITIVTDTVRTQITQSNPYWERDVLMNVSHPMDPREQERWYDFNKQEYVFSNLLPNKPMFDRTGNFPVVNNGLTSYADNKSCRDRGKEWFFPFISDQRSSFFKFTELHRFATELSQSLGIKVPRIDFGQADIGYGNLNGESIVSHSGAPIRNLDGISVLSRSAQYQDYRATGIQNLIYDGCTMQASDFNVDSPDTIDGGPVVEVIDTTPFTLTSGEPTLGEGPGNVSGEGIGKGLGSYSGRPIGRGIAAGRGQAITGGRMNTRFNIQRSPAGQPQPNGNQMT